jgi:hypothetical protein
MFFLSVCFHFELAFELGLLSQHVASAGPVEVAEDLDVDAGSLESAYSLTDQVGLGLECLVQVGSEVRCPFLEEELAQDSGGLGV